MNTPRDRTRATIAAHRFITGKAPRRRRVPRQASPKHIARDYERALNALIGKPVVRAAFADLLRELPFLLASAKRERGDGMPRLDSIIAALSPVDRVMAWLAYKRDAGEGKKVSELIDKARAQLASALKPNAIEALAIKFGEQTSTFQRIQLNRQTKAALGVDIFTGNKGERARLEGFAQENVALIKGIGGEVATRIEKLVTRALTSGTLHGDLALQLEAEFGFSEKRAALIARDQIGKYYGQINAARQKDLGIKRFTWRTVGDERVRDSPKDPEYNHVDLDGQVFSYDDPPFGQLPGEPVLCRCSAEPVFDDLLADDDEDGVE